MATASRAISMESSTAPFRLILDIQKGSGFNFLRQSVIVACSLASHTLETDPVQPSHSPVFESKLIWETEKNTFLKLCEQNIPIKIEIKTKGQKQQIGYLLISLLSAKSCTINLQNKNNYSWHKLLGVKFEGRSSNPQLLLNLFSDECCNISECPVLSNLNTNEKKNVIVSQDSKSNQSVNGIVPRICLSTQTIEIGDDEECHHSFLIELDINKYDYFNLLSSDNNSQKAASDSYFTLLIFSQILKIEKNDNDQILVKINLKSNLSVLSEYFIANPYAVIKFRNNNVNIGVCSFDTRKLIPSDELTNFLKNFCDDSNTYSYKEKCFMVNTKTGEIPVDSSGKKPYIDMEVKLQYVNETEEKEHTLFQKQMVVNKKITRSENASAVVSFEEIPETNLIYTEITDEPTNESTIFINTPRSSKSRNEENNKTSLDENLDEIIEKINSLESYNSKFQEKTESRFSNNGESNIRNEEIKIQRFTTSKQNHIRKKLDTLNENVDEKNSNKESNIILSPKTMENVMMQLVNELEDWKECQQEIFKSELKEKEEKYLSNLKNEWDIYKNYHENKLSENTKQCQNLVYHLKEIIENLKKREIQLSERERKLCLAKDEFDLYYRKKYTELKNAAKQMEIDYQHQLKLHKFEYSKLEMENIYLKQENSSLKDKFQL